MNHLTDLYSLYWKIKYLICRHATLGNFASGCTSLQAEHHVLNVSSVRYGGSTQYSQRRLDDLAVRGVKDGVLRQEEDSAV